VAFACRVSSILAADPVVLEQIVSRHDPHFKIGAARLTVGRDGQIYLGNGASDGGYVLRVAPDGKERFGGTVGYAFTGVAAGKDGTVATSEAHFSHRVAFWGRDFLPLGHVPDFLVSDVVQWNAPSEVEAGIEGDFYGVDQHWLRILRVRPPDKLVTSYALESTGEQSRGGAVAFRVSESGKRFVTAWSRGVIHAVDFDGKALWKIDARPAGENMGGFDLDDDGRLYLLTGGDVVKVFDADGKPTGEVKLAVDARGHRHPAQELRVRGGELIVKRSAPDTLFEVYDRGTGALLRRVDADVEVLRVAYVSLVWTAGEKISFEIRFEAGRRPTKPELRVWLRPIGVPEFQELSASDGTLTVPADARGLYQVRVCPDLRGRAGEYVVDGYVEIREPNAVGSVAILTPLNRFYYGQGEEIPVQVILRAAPGKPIPESVTVRLRSLVAPTDGPAALPENTVKLADGKAEFAYAPRQTANLVPGRYRLDAVVPGFTVAPQFLEIGKGLSEKPRFHVVQHGDYTIGFPAGPRPAGLNLPTLPDLSDTVADHLSRSRRLGLNLFVDRMGSPVGGLGELGTTPNDAALVERLKADPIAVAPEKAMFEGPVRRTLAGYGAFGIEEQGILLMMDAGLPVGTLFDSRKPEQMDKDLTTATRGMAPYPAFRGWSWAANWWLEKHGAAAAKDETEKNEYNAALTKARETGAWSPVLEAVSERTFSHAVEAEQRFRKVLDSIVPGKVSASTGPYRAIQTHPPVTFRNSDEVDLHYQGEQIQPPQVTAHHVDFYKRPGKRAWGHPELWNDDGTGGMIFPTLFQMAMRGSDGVGQSGPVGPGWNNRDPDRVDPRSGGMGAVSAFRAAYETLGRDGAWLAALARADRVAIVVSTRMQRLETWDGKIGGAYFDALFEAYNACLYAHRPASFVFAEDVKPDTLKRFQAVLVVGQRVELDPPLAAALEAARKSGVKVFCDGTCRPELVAGCEPLGVAFDRVKQDPSAWQDDAAYYRFPRYFKAHAETLRQVLGPVVAPVAECANPEVLFTECLAAPGRSDGGRFVWAVNNTMLDWDPGLAWRTTLLMTQRVPVVEKIKLAVPENFIVYDVFSRREISHDRGTIRLDLRSMPARVFAILPKGTSPLPWGKNRPADEFFGPHVRDVALSGDGKSALLSAFNWDQNLYGIDLATGATSWRTKIGHAFAYDPRSYRGGFAVQGFDVKSASGYHLYLVGPDGKPERRFALYGLPKRGTSWAAPEHVQDSGINSFAVAPGGTWVASAGDLGLAVWDRAGKLLWSDDWWRTQRKRVRLVALGDSTLVVLDRGIVMARNARDGNVVWSLKVADSGTLRAGIVCADGKTLVVSADSLGGRLVVIRDGQIVNTIPEGADQFALASDGSFLAAAEGRQLKVCDTLGGLSWTYTGDDTLRHPRISPDGKRIAVASELGTLAVLTRNGTVVGEYDLGALPVPAWLPGGDLFAATWMGSVVRFDSQLKVLWKNWLTPAETDVREHLLALDATLTVRRTGWGNAAPEALPLVPNLLTETKALIGAVSDPPAHGEPRVWQNKIEELTDGNPNAPAKPWLDWTDIGMIDSGWRNKLTLQVDTFRTQLRVTAITFAEDVDHPDSWLRDVLLLWGEATAETWRDGPMLLSDTAVHSHVLESPIEAAKFRFVSTGGGTWPVGNFRLGELVFHGAALGASHPDAVAGKPALVLFDERETDLNSLKYPGRPFGFRYSGAYSGGKCLELAAEGDTGPNWIPPFGHAIPNWDFEIAEKPGPGQFRYFQFAWKATSAETRGMSLLAGRAWPGGGVAVSTGDAKWDQGVIAEQRLEGKPPTEWQTVRVDLWTVTKGQPPRIQALSLKSVGGGACFDQIVLGRSEADLPKLTK